VEDRSAKAEPIAAIAVDRLDVGDAAVAVGNVGQAVAVGHVAACGDAAAAGQAVAVALVLAMGTNSSAVALSTTPRLGGTGSSRIFEAARCCCCCCRRCCFCFGGL